ncbi:sulfur carrier protein [Roseimicrobium gellanilyticum]|uniref:Sulfur carrier protein n=1 Tax=Roseimicrobium gellanilyticum TaxID=748857 RepID=A0A366HR27_9BACT|nr:sulfur carrier protein ThiS [Roseimicrobium gellanilyticum]RBP45299.1 sulfur carrier protein [Roseimicrobium gellanilyticum]
MQVTVNGTPTDFPSPTPTVATLLDQLGMTGKPVVVELNQRALFPRELASTPVAEGDVLELVQITAGG